MEVPMEFWGVEVKVGQSVKIDPAEPSSGYIHVSQVALGEAKKDKASEPVVLYLKVDDQKFVLGTLSRDDIPQLSLDLVLDSESEFSHNSKSASVYFCGYKVLTDDGNVSDFSDSDDDLALKGQDNGKPEIKAEVAKVAKTPKPVPMVGASAEQVKIVDPKKDEKDESDDDSDDESADEDDSGSSDEMDADSDSDEDSESDEDDEETPVKKVELGKKRANESASKTPVPNKKAKNATPEKTDGKKFVHTATPHPMKKGGKTLNSGAKGQSPNSGGQLSCKSCKKSFTSESGLQQHNKAKHGGQ
ncbi:histone deacetylase HDT1-like isoform X2 [Abrus precatorius]|uniref:Histone deacetylase HDT1-like isoform X2 n=1 Tax=Abrus precatorius TaxID=3816 RepID=A0A8B8KSY8_ABRPR|nr:histone deacetylase HDT1-like isoform X2 [Abrus precatorius]